MPLYDYKCREHGVFSELATLADHDRPCACPACGIPAPRVVLLPPQVLAMLKEQKTAMERNEQAREAPDVLTAAQYREREAEKQARAAHDHNGCGCQPQKRTSNLFYTANGEKFFPSMRPWMISH